MSYIPHEKLSLHWIDKDSCLKLSLPWLSFEVEVEERNKDWVADAVEHLKASNNNVQRLIEELKAYPIFYFKPRSLKEFEGKDLQPCPEIDFDSSTPRSLISTFGCKLDESLRKELYPQWTWNQDKVLKKARIENTDLYDPISLISYLICYRLEWESTSWSGQDGFGQFLESLLKKDEEQFFQAIGWVTKQSWYVTTKTYKAMEPALIYFSKARDQIDHFIKDEIGHHKFMEQVFRDIGLKKEDFSVGSATKWLIAAFERAGTLSPLAFSAMINIFEAAYYEGQDPISRVIKMSSKPQAAQGYDLHYKINQEHRHCDMPLQLSSYLAPQTYQHAVLTLGLFEITLHFLDQMEKTLCKKVKIH